MQFPCLAALLLLVLPAARVGLQDDVFSKMPTAIQVVDGIEKLKINGARGTMEPVPVTGQSFGQSAPHPNA